MAFELKDLIVDRVDLVDEGANSAAYIELYKRKETEGLMTLEQIISKMKPEHASVIQEALEAKNAEVAKANEALEDANKTLADTQADLEATKGALDTANAELAKQKDEQCSCDGEADEDGKCKACGKPKKSAAFDETETMKSMPENVRAIFEQMRMQKEAAEAEVRKAADREAEAEAVAKAASLKAIPVEQDKLVGILKSCSPEVADLLSSINSAIEATVLDEVGKNRGNGASTGSSSEEAWSKLEKAAAEIAKRDSVTKEKAMAKAVDEHPELYREYLNGGAK